MRSHWTVAHQAPLSMEFPRYEFWSGLPFPSLGDLPDPGIEPESHTSLALAGRYFTTESPGKPCPYVYDCLFFFFSQKRSMLLHLWLSWGYDKILCRRDRRPLVWEMGQFEPKK